MRALLLSAGYGTRLRPLTERVPKCLVPIKGRALLDYWCTLLLDSGAVDRILVNTSWLADHVRTHVQASKWRDQIDLVHETDLLGTGGTVLANRDWFGKGPFLVAHSDNLTRFDIGAFIDRHMQRPKDAEITMMTFTTDTPQSCGIIDTDSRGIVVGFHEKVANPPGNRANGAVYIFEPSVIDFIARSGKTVIDISTEVLPAFMGRISTFHNADYHRDIGTLESFSLAQVENI